MRQFDPDPRLQYLLNNLERLIDADFRRGSQLAYKPSGPSREPKIRPELSTQRRRRQVRRRIEHMRVAPEKALST